MNGGRRWLRVGGYTAVVLGGGLGWVLLIGLCVAVLASALLGSLFPFFGLWFLSSAPLLEVVVADSALILGGMAMLAASRR